MSRVTMLKPADGIEGIKDFVIQRVLESGSNPCPPVIVGVGIGGSMEKVALLATKALLRPLGTTNPDPVLKGIEEDLLKRLTTLVWDQKDLEGDSMQWGFILKIPYTYCKITDCP